MIGILRFRSEIKRRACLASQTVPIPDYLPKLFDVLVFPESAMGYQAEATFAPTPTAYIMSDEATATATATWLLRIFSSYHSEQEGRKGEKMTPR